MSHSYRQQKDVLPFFHRLHAVLNNDRAKAAVLRRNVGKCIGETRNTYWFYSLRNDQPWNDKTEEIYFLVATLFSLDKKAYKAKSLPTTDNRTNSMGGVLGNLARQRGSAEQRKVVERRLIRLLDASLDGADSEASFLLRQTVAWALAQGQVIAWPKLLTDLLDWNHEDKHVQKRWAMDYYSLTKANETDAPGGNNNYELGEGD